MVPISDCDSGIGTSPIHAARCNTDAMRRLASRFCRSCTMRMSTSTVNTAMLQKMRAAGGSSATICSIACNGRCISQASPSACISARRGCPVMKQPSPVQAPGMPR